MTTYLINIFFKAKDGLYHASIFTLRAEPQVIKALAPSIAVIQSNCIRCHEDQVTDAKMLGFVEDHHGNRTDRTCWECHREVPHGRVYAFVMHLRLVPALKNPLVHNLASLWAFSSIVMTSFGVNYYLSGLHSYAKGDPVPVPFWVYWVVLFLLTVSVAAVVKFQKSSSADKKAFAV